MLTGERPTIGALAPDKKAKGQCPVPNYGRSAFTGHSPLTEAGRDDTVFVSTWREEPLAKGLPKSIGWGVLLGLIFWYKCGLTLVWWQIAAWIVAGVTTMVLSRHLSYFTDDCLKEFRIHADGFTVIQRRHTICARWRDLQIGRIDRMNVGYSSYQAFFFVLNGITYETGFEGLNDKDCAVLQRMIEDNLKLYGITAENDEMPSMNQALARAALQVFVCSLVAFIAAHVLGFRSLGSVFGIALMVLAGVLSVISFDRRKSRFILVCVSALIILCTLGMVAVGVSPGEIISDWIARDVAQGHPSL